MNYDPAELAALLSEPWSNGSCRGYIIMAMENCGFASDDIRRIIAELHVLVDFVSLEDCFGAVLLRFPTGQTGGGLLI